MFAEARLCTDTRPTADIWRELHRTAARLMDCDVCAASCISKIEKLAETIQARGPRGRDPLAAAVIILCNNRYSPNAQMDAIAAVTAPLAAKVAA